MRKIILLLLSLSLIACAPTDETIKIGGLFALTGDWAYGGITEAQFVELAIDEINNEGGINGKKVEFILEDDQCSAIAATLAAKKLLQQDVNIILGPSCTPASNAVAPIAEEAQVVIFAATSTATNIFDEYEYAYRMSPEATQAAKIIADVAYKNNGVRNVGIIVEQTEFAQSWANEFRKQLELHGGKVKVENFITGTTDFKLLLEKLRNNDALFIATQTESSAALIYKQAAELGIQKQIMGSPVNVNQGIYELSEGALPPSAFTVVPHSQNKELYEKYFTTYNQEPGFSFFYTAAMYDAAYILKEAIENCEENSSCIRDYLKTITYDGKVTIWSFDENGDPIVPNSYRKLSINEGKEVYEKIMIR